MPNLTQKELFMIEDLLSGEELMMEKFGLYAEETDDTQVKSLCEEIQKIHQKHYNTLIGQLDTSRAIH